MSTETVKSTSAGSSSGPGASKTTPPNRPSKTVNALTSGRLPKWAMPVLVLASFVASFLIFLGIWAADPEGKPLINVVEQTGNLTIGYNWGGFLALGGVIFIVVGWLMSRIVEGARQAANRFVQSLVVTAFVLALIPLASLITILFINGLPGLVDPDFFLHDSSRPGERGGLHAIVGTLLITFFTSLITIPIGIFTAVYIVEYGRGGRLTKAITFFVDVMTGIPSIVAGLFAFALFMLFTQTFGGDLTTVRAGIVGSIALMVLMLPTVVRSSEEMIRLVPQELREASYALGVPKWLTIVKVVLPTCLAGLVTGVLLAIARVIGETAPLLVAAGMSINMNTNPFGGVMSSLPTFVYQQWNFTTAEGNQLAWAGALVLLLIVVVLNAIGRVVSYYFSPRGSR
ncbi:phosphate transport system permease protein PstA [Pseudoclavibacter endophyticus]|uniref:Phosphate transport system permease protein PstA n=1 Tax=Pseudoclavibacter endophyticus TaxID=1778590 RepID=A0A6H9WJL9_9MICO|nr:phosphate ABC transporter permease PstA [Pseudoclavibacter endophyticus]KAB1649393.1 phosphate ABC transporter permease PstA [Pseudoclavibacter endophyticus]GGA62991.1 phosphate transport system permease protein PstA [Pseudoclavibacter endophyticus]